MRVSTVVVALAVVAYWTGPTATASTSPIKWWNARQTAKVEQTAIDLSCNESDEYRQYDCSRNVLEEFESGRTAPETFIRNRCQQLESSWETFLTARAEAICSEYLGRPFTRS